MKIVSWFLGLVVIGMAGIYFMLFSAIGNAFLAPIVEGKIQEQTQLDSKLQVFSLSMNEFEVLLELNQDNTVFAKGSYSLFEQSFDAVYDVKLNKLETLEPLTKKPLKGAVFTDGTAKGDMAFMKIDGKSDVAFSATVYKVELTDLDPTSIIAKIQNANLVSLLELAGEKPYAQGKIDVDVNFKNIKPHELDGNILLTTKEGKLNNALMSKDFELDIPATKFSMKLDAKLKGDDVDYTYALYSNLAKISSAGNIVPQPLKVDITYNLDIKELAVLKPIIKEDVRGPFTLEGTAKGTQKNMIVEGVSDLASSDTQFSTILKNNKPVSLNASIENLKIEKLLYMLKQPHYGDGILSLNVDMSDLRKGHLAGSVISNIKKGVLDSAYLTKEQGFKTMMPKTTFNVITNTTLNGDMTETKLNLKSTLLSLDIEKAKYDLEKKSIVSDFTSTVSDLDNLFFITERHLKGAITLNGEIKKDKDLDLKVHSKVADGTLDAKMFNDDLHVDLKSIQTLKALEMLIYPVVFASSLNGVLDYNTKEKKGKFKGDLVDGKFTPNAMLSLVKQYGKVDLYKESFKGDVSADVNKEKLLASLSLASNSSSIKTKEAKLDSKAKTVDATIEITANKHPISVSLKGNTSNPAVSVDAGDILKNEVQKAVGEKLDGLLKGFF
ncbi:MAG: hypothetical protein H8E76_08110 [Helicobacteraceae bacterium]|nr:hypothetical protein [Candidatus Sulfurimonas ponti]MBL6972761.1 hypothetical protein [Sulfurimonas sp.]